MRSLIEEDLTTMILEAGGLASLDELSDRLGWPVEGIRLCVDLLSTDGGLQHPLEYIPETRYDTFLTKRRELKEAVADAIVLAGVLDRSRGLPAASPHTQKPRC